MTDTTWAIQLKNQGTLYATHIEEINENVTRGNEIQFALWLPQDATITNDTTARSGDVFDTLTIASGATYTIPAGVTVYAGEAVVNGTLTVNGTLVTTQVMQNTFDTLYQYGDWAGKFVTNETLNGQEKYRERLPTSASIDSIAVQITPSSDLVAMDTYGVWGLVTDMTDERDAPLNTAQLTMTVQVLAEDEQYADHAALETAKQV